MNQAQSQKILYVANKISQTMPLQDRSYWLNGMSQYASTIGQARFDSGQFFGNRYDQRRLADAIVNPILNTDLLDSSFWPYWYNQYYSYWQPYIYWYNPYYAWLYQLGYTVFS